MGTDHHLSAVCQDTPMPDDYTGGTQFTVLRQGVAEGHLANYPLDMADNQHDPYGSCSCANCMDVPIISD